jgi:hypothetical protein
MMSKRLLAGLVATLAVSAIGVADASACRRVNRGCGSYYAPPPVAYQYGPPPSYGYVPPAPVYGYGPPPGVYYASPYAAPVYGNGAEYYGYRGPRRCDRGYGYAPPQPYYGGYDSGYQPTGYWVPVR